MIICDMWDDHWCRGAARRVVSWLSPSTGWPIAQRAMGVLVIHARARASNSTKTRPSVAGPWPRLRQTAGPVVAGHALGNPLVLARPETGAGIADRRFGRRLRLPAPCEIRSPWTRRSP